MTTISSAFRAALVALSLAFVAACGGGDESSVPLKTAAEVKAAFEQAPRILKNYFSIEKANDPDTEMEYLQANDREPWHLVVRYKGAVVYDRALFAIYTANGTMADGTDVIVLNEHQSPGDWSGTSVVFVNGVKVPVLQSLPVNFGQYGYFPAAVREIREYGDGWFIIYARISGRGGYYVNRWAMYRTWSGEFIDCGELDSNREPSWGPGLSPVCVRR